MLLYHGSDKIIQEPKYNEGNNHNDYGKGFYMTPSRELAELWAGKSRNGGFCMEYEVDMDNLKICHLDTPDEESVMRWITVLVKNRFSYDEYEKHKETIIWLSQNYGIPELGNDMIIGYRADDAYFAYSRDFVSNDLSLEALTRAMHLGKLGLQYVLLSEKAFSRDTITLKGYYQVAYSGEYQKFVSRMGNEYKEIKREDNINNTFIRDIMRRKGIDK